MRVALVALLLAASCGERQPPRATTGSGSASVTDQGSSADSTGATMNAAVTVTLVGQKPGRPPTETLLVDVQLRNDDATPRWVLIPSTLPIDSGGGVNKLEQLTASAGATTVAVGRFLGRAGTYAVKLAPGARVTLRKLEVSWWREDPTQKQAAFDVRIASDVKLGDQAMAAWFDKDPAISGASDVDMASAKHTRSFKSPTGDEIPVVTVDATAAPVKLSAP
ncbi:MAG TPA: hypothetical protein VIV11_21660 [Kofleriaceae bacterium]